jgi:hypothetical protein
MLSVNKCRVKPKVTDSLRNKEGLAQGCFQLSPTENKDSLAQGGFFLVKPTVEGFTEHKDRLQFYTCPRLALVMPIGEGFTLPSIKTLSNCFPYFLWYLVGT